VPVRSAGADVGPRPPVASGVCPVLETPFTEDGAVDEESFVRVVDQTLRAGVGSVMFPGFASEFHKLTDAERSRLVDLLLERTTALPGVRAIVSVPDHATRVAVQRAREAVERGADAVNLLPPHFLGPSGPAVRTHVVRVLEAVAPVPVVLQYAPAQTGTALDAASIARIADDAPNLVQVKVESTPPGALISALGEQAPQLTCVVGYAGVQLPDALRRGAVGVQPGCSFVELYQRFWELWDDDRDAAEDLHRRMLPYLSYWMQSVELIISAEKLVSARRGLVRSAHCRAPQRSLDVEEVRMVDRFLSEFADLLPGSAA
jgi:4-hydroxy-tetrahydrodipicolinate synthase